MYKQINIFRFQMISMFFDAPFTGRVDSRDVEVKKEGQLVSSHIDFHRTKQEPLGRIGRPSFPGMVGGFCWFHLFLFGSGGVIIFVPTSVSIL